jgi:hypothetical protein
MTSTVPTKGVIFVIFSCMSNILMTEREVSGFTDLRIVSNKLDNLFACSLMKAANFQLFLYLPALGITVSG